jgi:tetratricopeptide (TPR) repeat protein
MKSYFLVVLLLTSIPALGRQHHSSGEKTAGMVRGLGRVHHPVSTRNSRAQRFFDQGLAYMYAFNHQEAERSFKRAAELDPTLAMAWWGVALAVGPNYNLDVDPEREKQAYDAIQKALSLSSKAPRNERAYIEALAKRYTNDPTADLKKLAVDYKNAMADLSKKYPDDLDAATLYAESMMNLRPWQLWSHDGKPAEETDEIIAVLESVMKRAPHHTGANHYYIHAVEASPQPGRALTSARRLKTLAPAAGHLVHMPAHIYIRVGDYHNAVLANEAGAKVDEAYIKSNGADSMYPMMYYNHNLHFLAIAAGFEGRFQTAKKAADQLQASTAPHAKKMSMLESFVPTPTLILVQFRRWDDILKLAPPDSNLRLNRAIWHYARGVALTASGKVKEAEGERDALIAVRKDLPADMPWSLNKASDVLEIATDVLNAKIALAKVDRRSGLELLSQAVTREDKLAYDEPPGWFLPVRETLGGVLLRGREYADAEKVFRAELKKHPRSGRALLGLHESLKGQGKKAAARSVWREFQAAWKHSDTPLQAEAL